MEDGCGEPTMHGSHIWIIQERDVHGERLLGWLAAHGELPISSLLWEVWVQCVILA